MEKQRGEPPIYLGGDEVPVRMGTGGALHCQRPRSHGGSPTNGMRASSTTNLSQVHPDPQDETQKENTIANATYLDPVERVTRVLVHNAGLTRK